MLCGVGGKVGGWQAGCLWQAEASPMLLCLLNLLLLPPLPACPPPHPPTRACRYTPRPWMVELQGVVPELKAGQTEIDGERAIPKWPETSADVKIPSVRSSGAAARLAASQPSAHTFNCSQLPAKSCCAPQPQLHLHPAEN